MIVTIDPGSGVPPYDQVRTAIEDAVARGDLHPGDRLPTVRALAANLGIAPNTVARAYRELEATGVLEGRGRHGTFVATDPTASAGARDAARAYSIRIRELGVDPPTGLRLARAALGL